MAAPFHTAESWLSTDATADVLRIPVGRNGEVMLLPRSQAAEITPRAHWLRRDVEPYIPERDSKESLPAFVNGSRWLVQCPCGSAQYASQIDPRFFCVECLNEWAGGGWITVQWPANADAIEAALAVRPEAHTRSWTPAETVAELEAQNNTHLVAR